LGEQSVHNWVDILWRAGARKHDVVQAGETQGWNVDNPLLARSDLME
jgi:hypothetical protein